MSQHKAPSPLRLSSRPAGPTEGSLLVKISDLPPHGGLDILYKNGDQRTNIFVQRVGDQISIFENRCPHAGTPLNMAGDKFLNLDGTYLICRTHGALFDQTSGKCVTGPCKGEYLRPIAFERRGDGLFSL